MPKPKRGEIITEGEAQVSLFKNKEIRKVFHNNEWYFSVTDVIAAITDSQRPAKYWSDLKKNLIDNEGFDQLSEKIGQLKMRAADGKEYAVDAANTETILRIIQSIPSPKAEPFKRWLAKVGYERIQEIQNPDIGIKRAILNYQILGRSDDWINARIKTIISRKELTDEWAKRGVQNQEYAILTNVISEETFGLGIQDHKQTKALRPSHNLRDHMTDIELVLTMLGEKSTVKIAQKQNAQGFVQNHHAAQSGGKIAGDARKNLEEQLGESVVSPNNFLKGRTQRTIEQISND